MSKDKLKYLVTIFVLTIIVCAININLSPDYDLYKFNWSYIDSLDYSEFLWSLVNLLSKYIFFDYNLFLFCITFITVYFKFKYLKDLGQSSVLIILYASSFLILHECIQIRLAFGLIFVLKSIKYSIDKKNFRSWLFLILGSLVHVSLIFFLIAKLISIIIKNKILLALILISIIYFFDFIAQPDNIQLMMNSLSQFEGDWKEKIIKYLYEFTKIDNIKSPPLQLYYVVFIYLFNGVLNFNRKNNPLKELSLVCIVLLLPVLMIPNDTILSRLSELCFYFLPIIQFNILKVFDDKKITIIRYALLFSFLIFNFKIFTNQLI
tara:strand:+ start:2975 stop:3937 length:963 start_codon:yes stop_codon:yes gene_type:complete